MDHWSRVRGRRGHNACDVTSAEGYGETMSSLMRERGGPGPLSSRMVTVDVYGYLTAAILRNDIPPASRVNINAVAVSLGVSATPVREALARLESDGLVTQLHLKGYRTTDLLTQSEIRDLWQFRMLIEPYGAGHAAEAASPAQIDALQHEIDSFASAPTGSDFDSYQEFSAHDARLHGLILKASGNDVITRAFERTHCHLHAFRLAYNSAAGRATIDEHVAIVNHISAGNATGAAAAMTEHLTHSRDRLLPLAKQG
jgi:DNA-binding GntR family transcriptional regulator